MAERAAFMSGRPGGISDNLYGDCKRMAMAQNWAINVTRTDVHQRQAGPAGDNTNYRTIPGRKKSMYA